MYILWRLIVNFFKITWNTINFIRTFIFNLLLIFFIILGMNIWHKINSVDHHVSIPKAKGALRFNLSGVIVDKSISSNHMNRIGYQLLGSKNGRSQENVIFNLVTAVRQAKEDKNITGMVLELHDFIGGSQASLEYLGKALREFRQSGKPIYAIGDHYTQPQYYLASYANKIFLSNQGSVDLHGFSVNHLYYKKLLDKLKINSNVFRIGTYKSAVEPFLRNNMSSEARLDYNRWIHQLWQKYIDDISINRNIKSNKLFPKAQIMIEKLKLVNGNMAQYALNNNLVDYVSNRGDIDQILINHFGLNKKNNDYNHISIYNYIHYKVTNINKLEDNNIAVIVVNGTIMENHTTLDNFVDSYEIIQQIRDARLDKKIKAIILRVDSPGGSVTASEMIRQELESAHKLGKKIVVSMAGLAASGGYWISTASDYIMAHSSTLTGSIGIFGVVNTLEKTLENIGIHSDGVSTSPLADRSIAQNLSNEMIQLIKLNIFNGYHNFINFVAKARKKTPNAIEKIAEGKIWTGQDALNNGLIDELGDFDDAIQKTVKLANLSQPKLKWYPNKKNFLNLILNQSNIYNIIHQLINMNYLMIGEDLLNIWKQNKFINNQITEQPKIYSICLNCNNYS